MNHSEIADVEEHINDENPVIPDTTATIHIINKFLSMQKLKKDFGEQMNVLGKEIHTKF